MSNSKSEFRFTVHANPAAVNDLIQQYLSANQFAPVPKGNANYYFFNDPMLKGKRSFEYYINGPEVVILAYMGTFEKPKELEGFVGALPKQSYKNDLGPLFEELKKLDMASYGQAPQMDQPLYGQAPMQGNQPLYGQAPMQGNQPPYGQAPQPVTNVERFVQHNNQKQENWAIVGFVMAILGILLAFVGITYGAVLLVLEFYFAIQGLHTRLKGLSIATIVLACVSIGILIIQFVLQLSLLAALK